jgi:4-hydroxy-tetrahydrodipicolinate synthase
MTDADFHRQLQGVGFTTTTPFGDGGDELALDAHAANVARVESAGAELFIPCGNTGEYYSLTDEERVAVVEATVDAVADATVVGGAGGSTKSVIQLIEAYDRAGADGAMVMHPGHTYRHERGLLEYYRSIVEAVDLPLVLYKRGPEVTREAIVELAGLEGVAGIKYAVNDVEAFSSTRDAVSDEVAWINGIAERFAPAFALEGADGFTTGIGTVLPETTLALWQALEAERWDDARARRDELRPLEAIRTEAGPGNRFAGAYNVPVVKHGLEVVDAYGGPVREPLVDLPPEDRERVERAVQAVV